MRNNSRLIKGEAILFDDIHIASFSDDTIKQRSQFYWQYFLVIKGFFIAVSDIFLATLAV